MKRKFRLLIIPFFLLGITPLPAQEVVPEEVETTEYNDTEFATAVALSHTITSSTGIAMSPLLGMGVLGAWKYYQSDDVYRNSLPWYSSPWVWGICFGIFLLLKSKDTVGAWIPEVVKKPITILDDIAEKGSAAIVALAVIPTAVLNDFKELRPQTATEADVAMAPIIAPILVTAGAIAIFIVVWFAFSALSSIKILSPSSLINTAISMLKGAVIAVFAALAALNPWVGLALSLAIIIFCALIFGWAFRWNVFGTLFVKDFLTGAYKKPLSEGEELKGFSTSHFPEVKPRTYGRISREDDNLVFSWHPWLFLPTRKSKVSLKGVESGARKGLFLPSVTLKSEETDRHRSMVDLRVRYRSHAATIQSTLGLDSLQPNLVLSGAQASWDWLRDQIKKGGDSLTQAQQQYL